MLLFGLFLEAYMHDFNLVYITLFFVFSVAFSAGPLGVLNLGQLKATFNPSSRLFARQQGAISLRIENPAKSSAWAIALYSEETSVEIGEIKAKSSMVVHLDYLPKKRGRFYFENCYLQSSYPFATARLTLPIQERYEGIIYPEPKGKSLASFLAQEQSYFGEDKEFDGLQSYDGTQKLSAIHWPSLAKGQLSVKRFSKEIQSPNLVFDFFKAGKDDETRLSQLCLWVLTCETQHLPFSIQLPKQRLDSRKEGIDDILGKLAQY